MRTALDAACMARAEELWQEAARATPPLDIYVCWSGGIDSTAVLVSSLRAAIDVSDGTRRARLVVVMDDESVTENEAFFRRARAR